MMTALIGVVRVMPVRYGVVEAEGEPAAVAGIGQLPDKIAAVG